MAPLGALEYTLPGSVAVQIYTIRAQIDLSYGLTLAMLVDAAVMGTYWMCSTTMSVQQNTSNTTEQYNTDRTPRSTPILCEKIESANWLKTSRIL